MFFYKMKFEFNGISNIKIGESTYTDLNTLPET